MIPILWRRFANNETERIELTERAFAPPITVGGGMPLASVVPNAVPAPGATWLFGPALTGSQLPPNANHCEEALVRGTVPKQIRLPVDGKNHTALVATRLVL